MKQFIILCLALVSGHLHAQEARFASSGNIDSINAQKAEWTKLKRSVNVSFASSNVRYPQDKVPQVPTQDRWNAVAWKGEKIHTQLLVWGNERIEQLQLQASDLVNEQGGRIAANHITTGFLKYVITDAFGNGCGHRKPTDFDSSLVADPIDTAGAVAVQPNGVQPVWVSLSVPADVPSGEYKGTLTVQAGKPVQLPITVKVLEHVLPPPSQWKFDLDLWQHPAAIARVHKVPLWSDAHFRHMKPYYTMLAKAGQKNITASIIHEPWNHQTYDDFPSLIKWIRQKDGSWRYDYTLFDRYVAFVMSCGINQRINCYTMVPWKLAFSYFDERTGRDTVLEAKTGTPEYNAFWSAMLKDFTQHLKRKGWFSKTSIAMDERPMKDMQAVIALLQSIDPQWKITLAGDYHPEIEKDIFEYCVASKWQFEPEVLQQRKKSGKPSTFYTCCVEPYPNGFTFSPPAEHVWIGWYAAAKGFTGYLRWAYNSWVAHPLQDSRFRSWPAGDTYQVYPGPRTSIRFEKLIEGIQDFEKIRLLQEKFRLANNTAKLEKLQQLLTVFELAALQNTPAADMVEKAKKELHSL